MSSVGDSKAPERIAFQVRIGVFIYNDSILASKVKEKFVYTIVNKHTLFDALRSRCLEFWKRSGSVLLYGISSPFLSDIELGRRFPSEEILAKLASALNVPLEDLQQYDDRGPIADLKRPMDSDPKLGFAFRTAVEKVKSGELTADDIVARLGKAPRKK
jgi:hypothetical protein